MARTISHYRIDEEIGRGGMGVVYRATDTRLGRPVAIKMLPAEATADAERNRRFVQEARSASALNHPHIVTIYDIDEDAGTTFIAMELVDGAPLDRLLGQAPLPVAKALEYGAQIASALEAAHAGGLVHRDIKPANIMITSDGRAKILDFGIAKLVERGAGEPTMTALGTLPGTVVGTAAYMSPEQAEGRPVDARSDIFSLGAVLYEMLAGRRPFVGNSDLGLLSAILQAQPPPLRTVRADVPTSVQAIVDRCLAKDPGERYQNAGALRAELSGAHAGLTRAPDTFWRRPAVLIGLALLLALTVAFAVQQTVEARRARWARQEAIPEIERLVGAEQSMQAVRLARQAEQYAPDDVNRVRQTWVLFNLATDPPGADVEVKDYLDPDGPWEPLGPTPITQQRLPFTYYRVRVSKPAYLSLEFASPALGRPPVTLASKESAPPGMVPVAGGPYGIGAARSVNLPDFWIDRLEVTNRDFKRFVDAGGYRDPAYWKEPFQDAGRTFTFDEAMARFVDATGRPGPGTWELGSYPEGQDDFPVGGISWFEAAAYAEFAGKSLPSLYHWYRAAGVDQIFSDILRLSNVDSNGPTKAGERQGLGPWGTLDMAGNVKEWCANLLQGTGRRYILGGGWNEPAYRFNESDARNPWERGPTFGVRLVKNLGPGDEAVAPVNRVTPDPASVIPVSDELYEVYARFYAYDRTPLNARMDAVDDSSPAWRKETVSFDAAYGGERIPAFLFLPKHVSAPYQTVVLFPSAYAVLMTTSTELDLVNFDFLIRSGRAVLYPVYQGTFERQDRQRAGGPSSRRDLHVQQAKDFLRAVDYLETRPDIDMQRLAYDSLSMGAYFGPIPLALEPRIKVAVLRSGGLRFNYPPETQPANFAPRVRIPVLLINGRDDFGAPPDAQRRLIELLGAPPEHKRHVMLDGGHVPNDRRAVFREVLDWLDKYLGTVE
jgi:eukaryotic-like serine/threonine-protein kinase